MGAQPVYNQRKPEKDIAVVESASMESASKFQQNQIICLEHKNSYLYAEVIDIIETRQICWGRPLMLAIWPTDKEFVTQPTTVYDLREGADILLPVKLFRVAIDTELISLIPQLESTQNKLMDAPKIAHHQLRSFIQQVWQDNPGEFIL